MTRPPFRYLLQLLWLSFLSISALSANEPNTHQQSEPGVWEKSQALGSEAAQTGKALGTTAAKKTHRLYQTVKAKGTAMGESIADTSRSAWEKTKQFGSAVAEKAGTLGESIAEKSRSLYHQAIDPTPQTQPATAGREI